MSNQSLLEKCCLIGQQVAGNPTHYMIEQALRQAGSDWRFLTFEVLPDALGDAIRGVQALEFRGVKIVDPYREAVLQYIEQQTEDAQLAGSANCLVRSDGEYVADNTLGRALVGLLPAAGLDQTAKVVLWGAGVTARAIAASLAMASPQLTIVARNVEKAQQLVATLNEKTPATAAAIDWPTDKLTFDNDVDLLVNATSISTLQPDAPLPMDVQTLPQRTVVVDVAYDPPTTWLVNAAESQGCAVIDGMSILVEQTALAFRLWSQIDSDRTAMREAAEEYLGL